MKFTHYLITRFNVPVNNWNKDKSGRPVLDDQWMENRIDLFARYCLPSIRQQPQDAFEWLIYCDQRSTPLFMRQLEALLSDLSNVTIRLVRDFDHLVEDLKHLLAGVETPYVITSRLDNDDGIGPDFISDIQSYFEEQDGLIINFTKGVLYDAYKCVLTEIRDSRRNHYGSLVEVKKNAAEFVTVVGYPHGLPPKGTSIKNLHTRFAWLKVIHERNMASKTNGIPLLQHDVRDYFNLNQHDLEISFLNTCIFVVRRLMSKVKRKFTSK